MDQIFLSELRSKPIRICKVLGKKIPPTQSKNV